MLRLQVNEVTDSVNSWTSGQVAEAKKYQKNSKLFGDLVLQRKFRLFVDGNAFSTTDETLSQYVDSRPNAVWYCIVLYCIFQSQYNNTYYIKLMTIIYIAVHTVNGRHAPYNPRVVTPR